MKSDVVTRNVLLFVKDLGRCQQRSLLSKKIVEFFRLRFRPEATIFFNLRIEQKSIPHAGDVLVRRLRTIESFESLAIGASGLKKVE